MFYTYKNILKTQNKNVFDISCIICIYRITEGFKTGDLQYINIAVQCNCATSVLSDCKLIHNMIKHKDSAQATNMFKKIENKTLN